MSIEPLSKEKIVEIESMDQPQLLARRAALVALGTPAQLSNTDLQELVTIHNLLRRRSSGPPSASKSKSRAAAANSLLPPKERLENLL